jgi:hypothetical protein
MVSYILKTRLASISEAGEIEIKEINNSFEDKNNPISARQEAFSRYMSYLDIIGESGDQEKNLSKHISKFSTKKPMTFGKKTFLISTNTEQIGVNLYFVLDEDFQKIKKSQEYSIIGNQEERAYLTLAGNLSTEMAYVKIKGYPLDKWTTKVKYWNYESDKENDIIATTVLFTPFNFWENWNPGLAEGYTDNE